MNTPLLLSAPVRVIRDAARAAKRTAGLVIERVTAGTLSTLLAIYAAAQRSFTPETSWRIMAAVQAAKTVRPMVRRAPVCQPGSDAACFVHWWTARYPVW